MLIAIVLLGMCQVGSALGALLLIRWYLNRRITGAIAALNTELVRMVQGEPCQLAAILNSAGRIIGTEAGRSAKASLMADLSHTKRIANAEGEQLALDAASEQSPMIGAALAGMGKRGSKMLNNPLIQLALAALSGQSAGNHSPAGTPDLGSVRDRLRRNGG